MTDTVPQERLVEILAAAKKATPGPWELDEVENRDGSGRFTSYAVAASEGRHVVDTLNSGVMSINAEYDEDGGSQWDHQGERDVKFIALANPQTITALIKEVLARRADTAALRAQVVEENATVAERELIDELTGALRFIMAFYEPGQTYLDTEAWKVAEAGGRRALAKGEAAIRARAAAIRSLNGEQG